MQKKTRSKKLAETRTFWEEQIKSWQGIQRSRDSIVSSGFWHRKISLPIPLGAGILALFILFSGVVYFLVPGINSTVIAENIIDDTAVTTVSKNSFSELFEFLESRDVSIEIHIQLPEDSGKLFVGDPQLLRAADFKREKN